MNQTTFEKFQAECLALVRQNGLVIQSINDDHRSTVTRPCAGDLGAGARVHLSTDKKMAFSWFLQDYAERKR
jgi:hypothetical protein